MGYNNKIAKMHWTYFRTIGPKYINSTQTWHKAMFDEMCSMIGQTYCSEWEVLYKNENYFLT